MRFQVMLAAISTAAVKALGKKEKDRVKHRLPQNSV
jgi:hypothetical protein